MDSFVLLTSSTPHRNKRENSLNALLVKRFHFFSLNHHYSSSHCKALSEMQSPCLITWILQELCAEQHHWGTSAYGAAPRPRPLWSALGIGKTHIRNCIRGSLTGSHHGSDTRHCYDFLTCMQERMRKVSL